jgi:hypothetical protein
MTDLENPCPFEEGDDLLSPIFPVAKRNRRRYKIISEGELVVQKVKENAEQSSQKVWVKKTRAWPRPSP